MQSSALPLGHAARGDDPRPRQDGISRRESILLVLSNGHGEDLIALKILEAIHRQDPLQNCEVLPLVGQGGAFQQAVQEGWLRRVGPPAALPSGGFSNQSLRGLLRDLQAGLPLLSWRQWRVLKRLTRQGRVLLAVGDLLPLLMACSSGARFGFVGTPKSDYTWRSGPGRNLSDAYHRFKGSEWDPWEWMLMRSRRCQLVAMRDNITARGLRRRGVPALSPGNPMMDGLTRGVVPAALERCHRVLVLCGSRMPEAARNFGRLMEGPAQMESTQPMALLVAVGQQPPLTDLEQTLETRGFRRSLSPSDQLGAEACWVRGPLLVLIGRSCFSRWAGWVHVGLATAGTATEQLVGLGIPALSLPGPGPQFKWSFARRQSRLLGGAVQPCRDSAELRKKLQDLLQNPQLRDRLGRLGKARMGPAGGSNQLARLVLDRLRGSGY